MQVVYNGVFTTDHESFTVLGANLIGVVLFWTKDAEIWWIGFVLVLLSFGLPLKALIDTSKFRAITSSVPGLVRQFKPR